MVVRDVNRAEIPISVRIDVRYRGGDLPILVDEKVHNIEGMQDIDNDHGVRDVAVELVLPCCEGEITALPSVASHTSE